MAYNRILSSRFRRAGCAPGTQSDSALELMCGIYGMYAPSGEPLRRPELLPAMAAALVHRGPDGGGCRSETGVALGLRRLRIFDLSSGPDTPLRDRDGRLWLSCNGEVYNYRQLRARFRDYPFATRTDVETLLPLYLENGVAGLDDAEGMFGIALYDRAERSLVLARDRAGEKPLFYTEVDGEIWFASEIQALLVGGAVGRELDEAACHRYLALGYVPGPATLLRGVRKIPAGATVRFGSGGSEVYRYWRPEEMQGEAATGAGRVAELRRALERAVRRQMRADVPVGIFLSGGLDSSLLATIAARQSPRPLQTFTASFVDRSYDEGDWAAECAARIGADHHAVAIDDAALQEAFEVVSGLSEPIGDPAALPTYLVAREARKHVTVALSGEGADELFGGYPTYVGHRLARVARPFAAPLSLLRRLLLTLPDSRAKVPLRYLLTRFLEHAGAEDLARHRLWFGSGLEAAVAAGPSAAERAFPADLVAGLPAGLAGFMLLDYLTYLREGLLPKIDRTTMLNSLEARAPFLDRRISELAWGLPPGERLRGVRTKPILKRAASEWLPRAVVHRRKRGLSVPVARLIDGPLRGEVDRLLDPARLAAQALLAPAEVGRLLAEHHGGRRNHGRALWTLVMFQRWLERWIPGRA